MSFISQNIAEKGFFLPYFLQNIDPCLEDRTEEGILCRVYSPLGKKEQGRFALECAVKSLTFYSKFFSVPYPLEKYDMIAIPDFSAGAMENWGLVLYRCERH